VRHNGESRDTDRLTWSRHRRIFGGQGVRREATYFFGSGISADLPGGVMAFLMSPLAGALPDVQFLFIAAPLEATPYLRPFTRPYADSFACRAVVLRPESRGRLELVSADPCQPMRIRLNFLATDVGLGDPARRIADGS
jgi:choline dehydrogenase-like flavoprotein